MLKQNLCDGWSVRAVGDVGAVPSAIRDVSISAKVPGCIHTDLLRAGKIPDPYLGLNEYQLQWIGLSDWEYRTTFDADAKLFDHERIDLVFDGLDTVTRIELNGEVIGETQNMHRSYRFDVRKHLKRGRNELRVTFASAVKYAFAMREKLGHRPWVNGAGGPFNFIRKMACNFGWDWGPVFVTCGMWKGVWVEGWSGNRIVAVRPERLTFNSSRDIAYLDVVVDLAAAIQPTDCVLELSLPNSPNSLQERATIESEEKSTAGWCRFEIEDPQLWWPLGHGTQPLYRLKVHACDDTKGIRIGLRTVELDTAPDSIGSKFVVKVNGKPIFCKGFNWIPDDCFLDRACDPARVRKRIQQAVDAGANMLRVWGGGIYETDDFYNICDELGVMVWQDFPFACAMYPEEEPFRSEVEAEARENVARLSSHPSLVLWNGNNENLWAYRDWGWKDQVVGKTWGKNYYLDLLPKIVKELDPSRPYWAASPWSGDTDVDNGIHPNDPNHGNMHVWGPWFKEDYVTYRKSAPRFCSEFGFQAPANYATIVRALEGALSPALSLSTGRGRKRPPSPCTQGEGGGEGSSHAPSALDFGSVHMRHRQKSGNVHDDGDLRNLRHLARHFRVDGIEGLIASLTVPDPKPPLPPPGTVEPLHTASKPSNLNFDDLHFLLQLNQCRALTLGVEWFRSRAPVCMGTLYWQLNDCWPVTSWAAIDGDGRLKPLWYATRRFYAPYLPTIQPEPDGRLALYLINDDDATMTVSNIQLTRWTFDMRPQATQRVDAQVPPRSVLRVPIEPAVATSGDPSREFLYFGDETGAYWFFAPDKDLDYPKPLFESELRREDQNYFLRIVAKTFLRDIVLQVDRLDPDATINEQLVTLMPDEEFTFEICATRTLDQAALTSAPVFQCANRFGLAQRG